MLHHHQRDAVGVCKACGKGLCSECAVDLGKGLACRDRCEADTRALIAVISHNVSSTGKTGVRQVTLWGGAATVAMGAMFLVWGMLSEPTQYFLVGMGGLFLAFGLFSIVRALRMPRFKPASASTEEGG
jgi:hypothetical protein